MPKDTNFTKNGAFINQEHKMLHFVTDASIRAWVLALGKIQSLYVCSAEAQSHDAQNKAPHHVVLKIENKQSPHVFKINKTTTQKSCVISFRSKNWAI